MRHETSEWLDPMMTAAEFRGDIDISALLRQASRPAAEAPSVAWLASYTPAQAIDWIGFGELLRERLGWDDYPPQPGAQR